MYTKRLIEVLKSNTGLNARQMAIKCDRKPARFGEWKNGTDMGFSTFVDICGKLGQDPMRVLKATLTPEKDKQ